MAGKIYVTGDCHGGFRRFNHTNFPEQENLDKEDYVIICGDFGGIWQTGISNLWEKEMLRWLGERSFTTLFVDGNHENFDRLFHYPQKEWKGGKVHEIAPSVLHLMRGQVYDIAGKKIFTFGGAQSHDIFGGILDMEDPQYLDKKYLAEQNGIPFRIKHISWWEEEMPKEEEYEEARKNLAAVDYKVDYVISHCCASSTQDSLPIDSSYNKNQLTDFLDEVKEKCQFEKWYFGHYHQNRVASQRERNLYQKIIPLGE